MGMNVRFRGKRIDNGELVYGYFVHTTGRFGMIPKIIVPSNNADEEDVSYQIDYQTLGMFTGLTDKTGKEIFGAIGEKGGDEVQKEYENPTHETGKIMVTGPVVFSNGAFVIRKGFDFVLLPTTHIEICGNQFEETRK